LALLKREHETVTAQMAETQQDENDNDDRYRDHDILRRTYHIITAEFYKL
jgi:hypothetical protein